VSAIIDGFFNGILKLFQDWNVGQETGNAFADMFSSFADQLELWFESIKTFFTGLGA
jgi:hypothetical protein